MDYAKECFRELHKEWKGKIQVVPTMSPVETQG